MESGTIAIYSTRLTKLLTCNNYCTTIIVVRLDMANVLNTDKQIAIIGQLAEGSSIRSIERAGVARHGQLVEQLPGFLAEQLRLGVDELQLPFDTERRTAGRIPLDSHG